MRLRWTEPAFRDLQEICDYVAERNGDVAARRIALKIWDGWDSLMEFPRKGRPGRLSGTRELVFTELPWLAVHRVREDRIWRALPNEGWRRREAFGIDAAMLLRQSPVSTPLRRGMPDMPPTGTTGRSSET